ncbi:Ethanolamine ammonia-lyase light chain [Loktanella atrilutea]|uniref:Ethanolamine ammonia-lyase small subunit n=1 Tax=Loktanella atrilutea TaxID=366533 RepID=A0A1M5E5G5_LOKAT|nr:ethanolamine ammonia-lyase subunit EutC [Loktanella atrilutea]SHF74410.1 Ethanolamine ammonia-lyase light chain [Loktanella atrilutea]
MTGQPPLTEDPWRLLRRFTDARIGLGRVGVSLPTRELLAFQQAHAEARDAVHLPLDVKALTAELAGIEGLPPAIALRSRAVDRDDYLRHPPKGGMLMSEDAESLRAEAPDLALVIADGLSSLAVQRNAVPFLQAVVPLLSDVRIARPVIVTQARVAVGDHVGALLRARAALVLIGERPGLSSPDSLGLYFTWMPEVGLKDARRNCISNVRPAGLDFARAASKTVYLFRQAQALNLSGVALKDRADHVGNLASSTRTFLSPPAP